MKVLAEKLGVPDEKENDRNFRNDDPNVRVCAANTFWQVWSHVLLEAKCEMVVSGPFRAPGIVGV